MADETNASIESASPQGQQDGGFRGGRGGREGGQREGGRQGGGREGGNREPGGFRIRLSDNEMRAARAIQEAFGLRSTVAALGLSLRTVAQLLEQGQLDEVVAAHRAQAGARPEGGRSELRREPRGAGGRGDRPAPGNARPNPFARPSKPVAVVEAPLEEAAPEAAAAEEPGAALAVEAGTEGADAAASSEETAPAEA